MNAARGSEPGEGAAAEKGAGTAAGLTLRSLGDLVEATLTRPWPVTIGVIADTHIPGRARALPPPALAALAGSDLILHAGDLTELAVLDRLRVLAPVLAVHGNVDPWEVAQRLPQRVLLLVGRWRIGLVHGDDGLGTTLERARAAFDAVDSVVFGHSHEPLCVRRAGVLLFNPGSATDRRRSPACSIGRLRLDETSLDGTIVSLSPNG